MLLKKLHETIYWDDIIIKLLFIYEDKYKYKKK